MKLILKYKWIIYISSLTITILILGIIGYTKSGLTLLESIHTSFKLLSFIFTSVDTPNWQITVAKVLSFLFFFSAAIKIGFYFIEEKFLQPIRLYFTKEHIVIFGFNSHVESLVKNINTETPEKCVVIIPQEKIDLINLGIKAEVVVSPLHLTNKFLKVLNIENAQHILCMNMQDTLDVQSAESIISYLKDNGTSNNVLLHIHIYSYILGDLFNHESIASKHENIPCDIRVFNHQDNSARMLFQDEDVERFLSDKPLHWLIQGEWEEQLSFMRYIAQISYYADETLPCITLVCSNVNKSKKEIDKLYPKLHKTATVNIVDYVDVSLEESVTHIAVLYHDDIKGLEEAIILNSFMKNTPIFLQQSEALMIENDKIIPFGLFSRLNGTNIVLNEELDKRAKNIHNYYRTKYTMEPWKELSLFKKNSNRMQAEHISIKLRGIGWKDVNDFTGYEKFLTDNEDKLQKWIRVEHLRWNAFHYVNGWDYAPERDDAHKLHDCLGPFESLSKEDQNKDEDTLTMIPSFV